MLQVVKQLSRPRFLGIVLNPHLRQALVRRQLAGRATEILALHAGGDTFHLERINPQGGNGKVWGLSQFPHKRGAYAAFGVQLICINQVNLRAARMDGLENRHV